MAMANGNGNGNGRRPWQWQWLMTMAMEMAIEMATAIAMAMTMATAMMTVMTTDTERVAFSCAGKVQHCDRGDALPPPPGHKGVCIAQRCIIWVPLQRVFSPF